MADFKIESVGVEMTLADSTVLNIENDRIMLGSFGWEDASSSVTDFQLGAAIAKKLSFEIDNYDDLYSGYDFIGAVVKARIVYRGSGNGLLGSADAHVDANGILELPNAHVDENGILESTATVEPADSEITFEDGIITDSNATLDADEILTFGSATINNAEIVTPNGGLFDVPVGVFYVVEKPVYNGATISFTCLDAICKTARLWTTSLTFPATLYDIYAEICSVCGIDKADDEIPNGSYAVTAKPSSNTITSAEMLCYISQLCGGFAAVDEHGALTIKQYGGVTHSLSSSFSSEVDTDDIAITGVSCIECFDETESSSPAAYVAGSAGYVLPIAENPLVQEGQARAAATFVYSVVEGMVFRPMRLTIPKDPTIHAGDAFIYTDRRGNMYSSFVTEVHFTTDDATTVQCNAKSATEQSSVSYSATAQTMSELRRLTATDVIFNKIYARGINADYINVGTLKGIRIEADEGLLGGWSIDDDGIEKIVQTSGNPYKVRLDAAQTGSDPFLVCYFQISGTWVPMMRIYPDGQAVFGNADYNGTFAVSPSTGLEYYRQGYGSLILRVGDESMEIIVHNESNSERVYISNGSVSIVDGTLQTTLWPGSIAMRDSSNYASMTATQLKNLLAKL